MRAYEREFDFDADIEYELEDILNVACDFLDEAESWRSNRDPIDLIEKYIEKLNKLKRKYE
jgi:hypothetical protein